MAAKCRGKGRVTKKPCGNWAIRGGTVCRMHGGGAKQVRGKAAARQTEADANKVLARLDVAPVADPFSALGVLAGQALAFKDVLAGKVNDLERLRFTDDKGSEQLRSEVALWERALDRCERFITSMAKLNIDERLVKIEEKEAELVLKAIEAAFDVAEVPADRRKAAKLAAVRVLRVA